MDVLQIETQRTKRKPRGRKDVSDKQEAVIELEVVRERIEDLIGLYHAAEAAGTDLSEAVKASAEEAGIQASVLRKFIAARAGEKFADKKRDAGQLSLLFEEVGE